MEEYDRNKEERLIESVRLGDREAFGKLYDKYAPLLFGVIRKKITDPQESEEILMDLFVMIWERIASYDPARQSLYIWIYTLAKELITKNRASHSVERVTGNEQVNTSIDVSVIAIENPGVSSPEILDLIYFKGYTYKEVVMEFKIPMERLKKNIRTEFNNLRETLVK